MLTGTTTTTSTSIPVPTSTGSDAINQLPLIIQYDPTIATGGVGTIGNNNNIQQPIQQQLAVFNASETHKEGLGASSTINGASLIAVNHQFVLYTVKNGLVRILSRSSSTNQQKSLLRFHQNEFVSDLQFFQYDGELLASVSHSGPTSRVMISRVSSRNNDIMIDPMLLIYNSTSTESNTGLIISKFIRIIWHPYNPNQFIIVYQYPNSNYVNDGIESSTSAMMIDTTKLPTTQSTQYNNCAMIDFSSSALVPKLLMIMRHPNYSNSGTTSSGNLTDLAFSTINPNYVVATFDNGDIVFLDITKPRVDVFPKMDHIIEPTLLHIIDTNKYCATPGSISNDDSQSSYKVSRILFLPHTNTAYNSTNSNIASPMYSSCFITGSNNNSTFTIWSPYVSTEYVPYPIQVIHIASSPVSSLSYLLNLCYGPPPAVTTLSDASLSPSCFLLVSCREQYGMIYAFHIQSQNIATATTSSMAVPYQLIGCNYVVPFRSQYPMLSCNVSCCPSSSTPDDDSDREMIVNFDIKLFAYQTLAAQCLQMTSSMLSNTSTPNTQTMDAASGITIFPRLETAAGTTNLSNGDTDGFEEYDIDDTIDDHDDDEEEEDNTDNYDKYSTSDAPDPSSLPIPSSIVGISGPTTASSGLASSLVSPSSSLFVSSGTTPAAASVTKNPFANWLGGAFATPTSVQEPTPPIPTIATNVSHDKKADSNIPAPPSVAKTTPTSTNLLSPMEILGLIPVSSTSTKTNSTKANVDKLAIVGNDDSAIILPNPPLPPPPQSLSAINGTVSAESVTAFDHTNLMNDIRTVIHDEIRKSLVSSIQNEFFNIIQEPMTGAVKPLQHRIDQLQLQQQEMIESFVRETTHNTVKLEERVIDAVTGNLEDCMRAMFTNCMRTVLIPTIESVSSQIFTKVAEKCDTFTIPVDPKTDETKNEQMEAMSKQLHLMSTMVVALTKEVRELRTTLHTHSTPADSLVPANLTGTSAAPKIDPFDQQRTEILQYIKDRNYEAAVRRGVSNKTVDMAVFCCRNISIDDVFGTAQPKVSQPILLCLMQQLGTVIETITDPLVILDWLQEIALSLHPPTIPEIRPHLPGVVQNVQAQVSKRISNPIDNTDSATVRRSLQKLQSLLRGILQ